MKLKRLFFLLLMTFVTFSAFAQNAQTASRVIDNAGLLSAEQKIQLEDRIASVAAAYQFDLVIVTENNIGDHDPDQYADGFFDNGGYGMGPNRDGSVFLQVTESRDFEFSPAGRGAAILNNTAYNKLKGDTVKFLRDDNPFEACSSFIGNWEQFLALEAKGRNYNFFEQWNTVLLIGCWVLALLIALAAVHNWKKKMNTALQQSQADTYTIRGSLSYNEKTDRLLYSNVTKTKIQNLASFGNIVSKSSRGGKY